MMSVIAVNQRGHANHFVIVHSIRADLIGLLIFTVSAEKLVNVDRLRFDQILLRLSRDVNEIDGFNVVGQLVDIKRPQQMAPGFGFCATHSFETCRITYTQETNQMNHKE
jgi:hypothetical protein